MRTLLDKFSYAQGYTPADTNQLLLWFGGIGLLVGLGLFIGTRGKSSLGLLLMVIAILIALYVTLGHR